MAAGTALASPVSLSGPGAASARPGAPALRALDKPGFTATPGELLALGKAAPTGDWPIVVLRDQRDVRYDDRGRATVRSRRLYVVQIPYREVHQPGVVTGEDRCVSRASTSRSAQAAARRV